MQDTPDRVALKANVVGLLGASTLGVVALSPAMTLYGCFGPAFLQAGKAAPLAFVLALLATLPTAASYAILAHEHPDSGSAASWMARAVSELGLGTLGSTIGKWAGWIVFFYYFNNFVIQPVTLGVFLNDLLRAWNIPAGFVTYTVGAALCCGWPAWIVYRGISRSSRGAFRFLVVETTIVTALCLTVVVLAPKHLAGLHFSLEGFTLRASPDGATGLLRAMVFGMLAFCGFDVISTLSEETKMSRRLVPQATFLALGFFGALIIGGVWGFSYAATPERLRAVADSGGMPISEIAREYWGRFAFLVPITAITAALGIAIAASVGASRVLYSMARADLAPRRLGELHASYRVPWNAMNLVFAVGGLAAVVTGALLGPFYAFNWWGTTSTFFAMVTFLMVNFANLVLFRRRAFASVGGFLLHALVPMLGIAADSYLLIRSFFIELWNQGWANGQSAVVFDVLCALVALGLALSLPRRREPLSGPGVAVG